MKKTILLVLLAALCCSCGTPLFKAELSTKIPDISIGKKYTFYNSWGLEPGVVQCDTIEVIGHEKYCVYFCKGDKTYIMSERRFKNRMVPLKE